MRRRPDEWLGVPASTVVLTGLLLGVAAWLLWPVPTVDLTDERSGRLVGRLAANGTITMRYVHSIYHQPAAEVLVADPAGLRLVRLSSPSEAVLEYYARPEPIHQEGDQFAIDVADATGAPISALASQVGRRSIEGGGKFVMLHEAAPHGTPIRITVANQPRLFAWLP
ncbi:MAG: hypothetical protein U0556_15690 [Dehalococcoidia bacterium]